MSRPRQVSFQTAANTPPGTFEIGAADLGPRNASAGETMTASWPSGYTEVYEFDGKRWMRRPA